MEIVEVCVYKFEELSDSAKDTARSWFKDGNDYPWWTESLGSIKAFCKEFGVEIKDYQIGIWGHSYLDTNAENHHFRGRKLKDLKRDQNPTGYCLDCTLWETFHDTWKETGDPLNAFNEAIHVAVRDIVKDMEYQNSDEAVDEMLIMNDYEFDVDGKRFKY
jgi:hypothetical protein